MHMDKTAAVSPQDKLIGALIGLARATDGNEHLISDSSTRVVIETLFATLCNASLDPAELKALLERVEEEKRKMVPDCFTCAAPCGKNREYDMRKLWEADAEERTLKSLLLLGIRGISAYAHHGAELGYHDSEVDRFLYKALVVIGIDGLDKDLLLPIVLEMGEINLKAMALLEKANSQLT